MLTAPGQGAIGVEIIWERTEVRELLSALDHRPAHAAVQAERDFLLRLGGDCHSPVAAEARWFPDSVQLQAEILMPDGSEVHRTSMDLYDSSHATPADVARILLDRASPALRGLFAA
jgi:hydroxymethylbilane synthase